MIAALLLLLFVVLTPPKPVQADFIPISYQLLMAFQPSTLFSSSPSVLGDTNTPISIPVTNNSSVSIALLGDSMIDTLGPAVPSLKKALTAAFPNTKFNILNYGYGTSTIEESLKRLTLDYTYQGILFPSLLAKKPDIIVIESFAYNNFGNTQSGFDRQWTALTTMVDTIHNLSPKTKIIIATTIAPNSVTIGNGIPGLHYTSLEKVEKAATIRLYLENAIKFASSNSLPLANAYDQSLSGNDGNKIYISSTDHLHPSATGAQLFSTTIAKAIVDNNLIK